jgi:hypothetical protein
MLGLGFPQRSVKPVKGLTRRVFEFDRWGFGIDGGQSLFASSDRTTFGRGQIHVLGLSHARLALRLPSQLGLPDD